MSIGGSFKDRPDVWPQARPFRSGDGSVGVVVSHGFTGSVQSIKPWAAALATPANGWPGARVIAPRLPGHGTNYKDMARTRWWDWYAAVEDAYLELRSQCSSVFVAGLSMGGALALLTAQRHDVAGLLLVNPGIATRDRRVPIASAFHRLVPAQRGIASDIAKPGTVELGYEKFSVTSLATMNQLWRGVRRGLGRVDCPVLLMRSPQDHVVDDLGAEILTAKVRKLERIDLERSYHVATLDHDAELIFESSRSFIKAHLK